MEKIDGFLKELGVPLQVIIDRAKENIKSPFWYQGFFGYAPKTVSLDFTTAYGEENVEAMAAVIHDGSNIPLHGREAISKLQGEIPTIAVAREMTAKQYRELLTLRSLANVSDQAAFNAILDNIYNDVNYVGNAVHRRLNAMALQAVSSASIVVDNTNNPDGISFTLNLGMPSKNKRKVAKAWSDPKSLIVSQIQEAVEDGYKEGKVFAKLLVSRKLFGYMIRNEEVQNFVRGFLNITGNANVLFVTNLDNINGFLTANALPYVEIVETVTPVQKDGKNTVVNSWNEDNAVLVPAGNLGMIHSAFNNESIMGNPSIYQYGDFNGAQIMRWYQKRPLTEYTAAEYLAIPGYEQVANSYIIMTNEVAV